MKCDALMITYNRIDYTRKSLPALLRSDCNEIYVIDNGSTDGTKEYIDHLPCFKRHSKRNSIASAMNYFLKWSTSEYVVKVDNDTIIPPDFCARMMPHMKHADIVQAKHSIIKATDPDGWEGFTKNMKRENGLLYNHFVGGSGIMFKRDKVKEIPETEWLIGGWRQFQREHPELKKAFCEDVEIELLDAHGYDDYPEYYKSTGRIK
jgi:glycosyltransferase involved in cell wall biosynthesis